jgi:glycosyltransferase involved in cell wall biosynthesis
MRQGQNPTKMGLPAYNPKRLGISVLSYIPSQEGYFVQSLEILKVQIASIHRATREFDLLVFDNGSCLEVQQELQRLQIEGLIHFLILSRFNLGKTGALNWILASLQNELIAFADGDVLFRPGWFEKSLEILEAFPSAGLVSAQPCFFDALRGKGQAHLALQKDGRYKLTNETLDPSAMEEYGHGVGLSLKEIEDLKKTFNQVIEENNSGVRAVIGASHMQFIIPREVARRVIPLPASFALSPKEDTRLNTNIDRAGYLHLSTLKPYVHHIGNRLDQAITEEIQQMDLSSVIESSLTRQAVNTSIDIGKNQKSAVRFLNSLSRLPFIKKSLQRLYNLLFYYYSQSK